MTKTLWPFEKPVTFNRHSITTQKTWISTSLLSEPYLRASVTFVFAFALYKTLAKSLIKYEGWNFNFGNAAVTFDTAHLHSLYLHRPPMYSQRWGSRMMPLTAPVLLMFRTERSTAEGLNPPLQLSYTVMLPYRKPLPVLGNSFAVLPLPDSVLTKNAAVV